MKKILASLALVGLTVANHGLNIGLRQRFGQNNESAYDLSCDNAHGAVKYYVNGLPQGVSLNGSAIVISANAVAGTYTITVTAVDDLGQTAQRTISLSIVQSSSTSGVNNGAFGGQLGNLFGGANSALFGGAGGALVPAGSGSAPSGGSPAGGAPGAGSPAGGAPGTGAPTGGAPGSGSPAGGAPGSGSPAGGAPGTGAPTGGSPAGGAPGSGSPAGGAPDRLTNILSTFSSTTDAPVPSYPGGRYPTANLPTNPDPNAFNPTPVTIGTQQAPRTDSSRNNITPDDVQLRAASERHQNAIKAITNLLSIIDQAKANKDKAQNDIQTYTQAYNDAVAAQRNAQNDIIAAETRSSQIVSAINALTKTIDDLNGKINAAGAQIAAWTQQRVAIVASITTQEGDKAKLLDKLNGLNADLAKLVKDLSDKNAECQGYLNTVNNKQNDLNALQAEFAGIDAIRAAVQDDVNKKGAVVDDLRKRLQDAEKALADAKIKLADLDNRKLQLPVLIAALTKDLTNAQTTLQTCQAAAAQLQATIDGLKTGNLADLAKQINDLGNNISNSRTQVSALDGQIASTQGPLEDLKAKLAQANADLAFLRTQKTDVDATLRVKYQQGNDANNRVAFAKQNLDAIVKRFQDESKIVSDANLNLERARAEQGLARLGLEELIQKYSDALPYAIVPNGNGQTNAGTPYGNNPSGSPLGPIRTDGNGAPGSFTVNSWTNYLSSAYGAGVNPAFPGSVTRLFPFNFLSGVSGNQSSGTQVNNNYGNLRPNGAGGAGGVNGGANGGMNGGVNGGANGGVNGGAIGGVNGGVNGGAGGFTGGCSRGASLTQRVTVGAVVAVRGDSFDIKADDGQVYTIRVAPCTQLNANVANYQLKTGHTAVAKGYGNGRDMDGTLVTCLQ